MYQFSIARNIHVGSLIYVEIILPGGQDDFVPAKVTDIKPQKETAEIVVIGGEACTWIPFSKCLEKIMLTSRPEIGAYAISNPKK